MKTMDILSIQGDPRNESYFFILYAVILIIIVLKHYVYIYDIYCYVYLLFLFVNMFICTYIWQIR